MKKSNKRKETTTIFMEGQRTRFIAMLIVLTAGLIFEKMLNLKYLNVQRYVQDGDLTNWQTYLTLACGIAAMSLCMYVLQVWSSTWIERVMKVGFFREYNGILQEDGRLQSCLKIFNIADSKVNCITTVIKALVGIGYTIMVIDMVQMNITHYVGAAVIFTVAVAVGVYRGKLQSKTETLSVETNALQQRISNFFMISEKALGGRLNEIKGNYRDRSKLQCLKMACQQIIPMFKTAMLIILFFNATTVADVDTRRVYSTFCLIASAYSGFVEIASSISDLIENFTKIKELKKDVEAREVEKLRAIKAKEREANKKSVIIDDDIMQILPSFSVAFKLSSGTEVQYKIPETITVTAGKIPLIVADNGAGKSVLCKAIRDSVSGAISYDTKTGIVELYYKNLIYHEKQEIDFELVQRLAKGLDITRIPVNLKKFMEYKFETPNSADRQMMILLQILYAANLEARDGKRPVIILDEIFANLSANKVQKIFPFLFKELKNYGAFTIIVSHAFQDELKKYVGVIWKLEKNENNEVIIVEEPV